MGYLCKKLKATEFMQIQKRIKWIPYILLIIILGFFVMMALYNLFILH